MLWRSEAAPRALKALADSACAAAEAARDYFSGPSPALAAKSLAARRAMGRARLKFDEAVEQEPAPRSDWLEAAAALAQITEEGALAAEEAERFEAKLGDRGVRLGVALAQAARLLRQALDALEGAHAPRLLAEAKSKALQIEQIRRRGRDAAFETPILAEELKTRAVLDRFSRAAEAVHRAADALAARLAENA